MLDAARSAARIVVAFDMEAIAAKTGSVVSAVLFGAISGARGLPFPRAAFEDTVRKARVGVEASLGAFASGFAAAASPAPVRAITPPEKRYPTLAPTGRQDLDALIERMRALPAPAQPMLAAGLARVTDYQDPAYGAEYLDHVAAFVPHDDATFALTTEAAKQVASAMAYDDVIRVADLKTRTGRLARIRDEVAAGPAQLVSSTEFMHPGVAELCGLLPARLGERVEASEFWTAVLERFARGRHVQTDTLRWFVPLYLAAGLRRFRRGNLRHAREAAHLREWLARAMEVAPRDPALALEVLRARRLVKGYSDTHARGLGRFDRLMGAAARLDGRPDAAAWMRRLREAALRDAAGAALDDTLRTIDGFLGQSGGAAPMRERDAWSQ